MCLEAARVAAPTHCGPPRAQVRVHTVYEERPSEWTEWTAFGNVTVGIRGSIVVRRQDGNYSQIYEDAQVGVVYTLNVTLVAQSAGRVQVGGTTVRLQFASTHGNCVLGASLGASGGDSVLDVPFDEGVMSSTAAQMRCDSVAYEATRLQAQERGINHRGLPSVNNFSSYLSNGFEAYDVPSAPRDLIAASPATLTSAAFLNFSVPLTDNNNRIREYEIGWQNAEAGKAASDSGVQMMQPAQMPSLVVRNLTNAESYSLRARAHNRAGVGPWSTWTSVEVIPGRFSGVASSFSRTDAGSR